MKGFSLIEIITAVAILAVGISGSVALISRTISATSFVRNQFIAWQLAQEGMEVVHNIRNTNWVENVSWEDGLNQGSYCVDYNSMSLGSLCAAGEGRRMFIQGNRYVHNSGAIITDFFRHVEIINATDTDVVAYKQVISEVVWGNNTIRAEERLYDLR